MSIGKMQADRMPHPQGDRDLLLSDEEPQEQDVV